MEYNGVTLTEDMIWALAIIAVMSYAVQIFYCRTLKKTLNLVSEDNRLIKPNAVWLTLIPIFSIYWNFIVVSKISDSLTNEFFDRKIPEEENPGRNTGISYSILLALANIPLIQGVSIVAGFLAIVYFIKYWIKIDNFKVLLEEHNRFLANKKEQKEHETI